MKTSLKSTITPLKKYKICHIIIAFILVLPITFYINNIQAAEIDLEINDVDYETPIIEGTPHKLTILIKNIGDDDITTGIIEDRLYLNSVTTPIDTNSTDQGLSKDASRYLNLSWIPTLEDHTLIIKLYYNNIEKDDYRKPITVTERQTDLQLNFFNINGTNQLKQPHIITANITNTGKTTTKAIKATLSINDKNIKNQTLIGLNKNQSHNYTFQWTPSTFGYHIINISIDPENKISEADETNNYQEQTIFIQPHNLEWYNPNWHYRKFYTINGTGNISIPSNFTAMLNILGLTKKTLENDTIIPISYKRDGTIDTILEIFTFKKDPKYDPQTNANGSLIINITDDLTYLYVYFDVEENNQNRDPIPQKDILPPSGNLTITNQSLPEGWWAELLLPPNNFYPLDVPSNIEATTQAKAAEAQATILYENNQQDIISFNTSDFLNWITEYTFDEAGNWTINLSAVDDAGYQSPYVLSTNLTIQAIPDLSISKITIPSGNVTEGSSVTIRVVINNSNDIDAKNYHLRLYIAQDVMRWEDSYLRDEIIISLKKDESKTYTLTWETAIYGPPEKDGEWIIGIWIVSNSSYPDSNPKNNRDTAFPLIVKQGEQFPPEVELINPPSSTEQGQPVTIQAIISDLSGIRSVNITIINPLNSALETDMSEESENRYTITYNNTQIVGIYKFRITAVDNSYYSKKTVRSGTFDIIEDATAPTLSYSGVFPRVQLIDTTVTFICITHDIGGISSVELLIIHPDGYRQTISMTQTGSSDKYRAQQSFSLTGKYNYSISIKDKSNNVFSTDNDEFWITSNLNDTDNDGMPDNWEERYGLNPFNPADANDDPDNDGSSNLEEYKKQTDPHIEPSFSQQFAQNLKNNAGYLAAIVFFTILIILLSIWTFKRR